MWSAVFMVLLPSVMQFLNCASICCQFEKMPQPFAFLCGSMEIECINVALSVIALERSAFIPLLCAANSKVRSHQAFVRLHETQRMLLFHMIALERSAFTLQSLADNLN